MTYATAHERVSLELQRVIMSNAQMFDSFLRSTDPGAGEPILPEVACDPVG